MRLRATTVGLALALLSLPTFLGCSESEGLFGTDDWGTVSGYVRDDSGQRLVGATVNAGGRAGATDGDGYFSIGSVGVGQQTVSAAMPNYVDLGGGTAQVTVPNQGTVSAGTLVLVPWNAASRTVYLWRLDPTASSGWDWLPHREDQLLLGGTRYLNGMSARLDLDGTQALSRYNLGRRYSRLQMTAGVSDEEADVDAMVVFLFRGDATDLYQTPAVKLGQVANIDLDVSNVLTLDIVGYVVEDTASTWPGVSIVWGDPQLTVKP